MQVPLPWHSIKGIFRKFSKQEPGEASGWPEPSAPTPVSCGHRSSVTRTIMTAHSCLSKTLYTHHNKGVPQPQGAPPCRAVRHLAGLTMQRHDVSLGLAHRAPAPGGTRVTGTQLPLCVCKLVCERAPPTC